jgi:hypothetical protein
MIAALDATGASATARNISSLQLETDGGLGGVISYSARLELISDVLESVLKASPNQLGYEVLFDRANKKLKPHFWIGTDRSTGTEKVVFSTGLRNISKDLEYSYDASALENVAYVGDSGEDAARTFTKVAAGTEATDLSRRESFVDGNDCTTAAELTAAGTTALVDASVDESMTFSIMLDNSFRYMSRDATGDFDLGDIIIVVYSGLVTTTGRIMEIIEGYNDGDANQSITLTVGGTYGDENAKFANLLNTRDRQNKIRSRV